MQGKKLDVKGSKKMDTSAQASKQDRRGTRATRTRARARKRTEEPEQKNKKNKKKNKHRKKD